MREKYIGKREGERWFNEKGNGWLRKKKTNHIIKRVLFKRQRKVK